VKSCYICKQPKSFAKYQSLTYSDPTSVTTWDRCIRPPLFLSLPVSLLPGWPFSVATIHPYGP
jgi:hypothetical protein